MTPACGRVCPRERGFALAETLIATAIIAVMTAFLYQIIAGTAQQQRLLADRRIAIALAQSLLDQATVTGLSGDMPTRGSADGFDWQIARSAYGDNARAGGVPISRVAVSVARTGAERPLVQLETLQLSR